MPQDNLLGQVDELLRKSESLKDPAARELIGDTIRALMELHGEGLSRMFEQLADLGEPGIQIIDKLATDQMVCGLMLLHGLHPHDLPTRVGEALEQVRPYLKSHGGNVELLGISDDGEVRLQMQGSCHGCPSSAATLKNSIEQAIYDKAPDVTSIRVVGVDGGEIVESAEHVPDADSPPAAQRRGVVDGFVPLEQLTASKHKLTLAGM